MCCSESRPAWLVVSLGAVRQLAALELVYDQDMTYTLSLGNASDGPFLQVASQTCERCMMNVNVVDEGSMRRRTFDLAPTAAAFVRLAITWSSAGGIGGCADLCDWATNIYDFKAYSPGRMQEQTPAAALPEVALHFELSDGSCATDADAPLVSASDMERSIVLTGDAVRLPEGSGVRGASAVMLTPPEPQRFGAVEYSHIVQSGGSCLCDQMFGYIRVTVYVWLGGSASMPGEGLVISLVDADKQTPGKTVFKRGCGTRPALPESAVSIVLDTSDSDPSCDEPGTGARMVASLEGSDAPFVLCSTLSMSTAGFRTGSWIPVQFEIQDSERWHRPEIESSVHTATQKGDDPFVIGSVWVNGSTTLSPYAMLSAYGPLMRAANVTLKRFYIVVSARSGAAGDLAPSDRHTVSGVRVECPTQNTLTLENWDGFRQPFTPPPASPPWQLSMSPPLQPPHALQQLNAFAGFGGVSFGVAFACTFAFFLVAGAVLLSRRSAPENKHAALEVITAGKNDEAWMPPAQPAKQPESTTTIGFHVFLSYLRDDARFGESLHDKLRLAGLHVFKDNYSTGHPLDAHLICLMRATPVFAPLVTLSSLQRLSEAATTQQADPFLAVLLAAFCLRETGELRLIHPLLVGPATEDGWTSLLDDPAYGAVLAALPDAIPSATTAAVASMLRHAGAPPMPPHIAALTVREVLIGRTASQQEGRPAVAGVLSGAPFVLACPQQYLGLYVSHQFVPPIWEAVPKFAD